MAVLEEITSDNEVEVKDIAAEVEHEVDVKETPKVVEDAAPPAAPAAPDFKLSQIVPMVAMLGLQKFDLQELGYVRHVEIAYVIVQLVCFAVHYLVYTRINESVDSGRKLKIPEVKQMGQVVTPAQELTPKEYDLLKLKESVKQPLMGFVILGGIYYKWGSLMPLVMQVLMTPLQLYEAPLTQIHILGKSVSRPFPVPSMFGLPSTPEAPADEKKDD